MRTHPILEQLEATGVRLGLERVRGFLQFLGEPHRAYPVVHVAGTNGKGSAVAMITQALVEAGYRVGTYLSPHLEEVNERVQIGGKPLPDPELNEAIEALDRDRWAWSEPYGNDPPPLTYYEFLTVLAFRHFAACQVEVAVVEVGMGGRLDATNVVSPQVCAITSVGMDHMKHLGSDLGSIATEKTGIFERGVPAVVGALPRAAREVVEARARMLGMSLWKPGADLMREQHRWGWSFKTPAGALNEVRLGLEGAHQGANALVALGVLHRLREQGFLIEDDAIRAGLSHAEIPGRLQELRPSLWVDGAHNADAAKALAAWLESRPRPKNRILLLGMGRDRDPVKITEPLLPFVDEVVTTRCPHPQAREPMELAAGLQDVVEVLAAGGPVDETLAEVYAEADETVVAGSLYLAGAVRRLVREGALEGIEPGQGRAEADEEQEDEPV